MIFHFQWIHFSLCESCELFIYIKGPYLMIAQWNSWNSQRVCTQWVWNVVKSSSHLREMLKTVEQCRGHIVSHTQILKVKNLNKAAIWISPKSIRCRLDFVWSVMCNFQERCYVPCRPSVCAFQLNQLNVYTIHISVLNAMNHNKCFHFNMIRAPYALLCFTLLCFDRLHSKRCLYCTDAECALCIYTHNNLDWHWQRVERLMPLYALHCIALVYIHMLV